jgi:hypothetical protein
MNRNSGKSVFREAPRARNYRSLMEALEVWKQKPPSRITNARIDIKINSVVISNVVMLMIRRVKKVFCGSALACALKLAPLVFVAV